MKLRKQTILSFQKKIFSLRGDHKRDLPWRHTRDPYKILVSEIMLQQTQVSRVLPKYDEFLYFFPEVYDLAKSPTSKVLKVWKGMGYNRRVLYLKQTAQTIVDHYKGEFPQDEKSLMKLPGIGKYTARAILVFAFKQNLAFVDTNIRQIFTHFFFHDRVQKPSVIQQTADQLLPRGKAWEWHQALMDYGALEFKTLNFKMKTPKKYTKSFKESNRFYRGRIMDLLREKPYVYEELSAYLIQTYKKDSVYFHNILRSLEKDGLIEIKDTRIALSE